MIPALIGVSLFAITVAILANVKIKNHDNS